MDMATPEIIRYIPTLAIKFYLVVGAMGGVYAFYVTYIKPMYDVIESVEFLSVSPPEKNEAGDIYLNVELEIRMRQQDSYQFVVKVDKKEISNNSFSENFGKSYNVYFDIPRKSSGEWRFITIGLKGHWPKFYLTRRKFPLIPILRRATKS